MDNKIFSLRTRGSLKSKQKRHKVKALPWTCSGSGCKLYNAQGLFSMPPVLYDIMLLTEIAPAETKAKLFGVLSLPFHLDKRGRFFFSKCWGKEDYNG